MLMVECMRLTRKNILESHHRYEHDPSTALTTAALWHCEMEQLEEPHEQIDD